MSHLQFSHLPLIDELYRQYRLEASSVPSSWRYFFEGVEFGRSSFTEGSSEALLLQAYRTYGYLEASFNPMVETIPPAKELPKKDLPELVARLREIYCGSIGYEYMGLGNLEMEQWLQNRIEARKGALLSADERAQLLVGLERAEVLETFLHTKYPGQTRFSLEGLDMLVPMLTEMIEVGSALDLNEWILGMAHRGRLNVLVNVLDKPCVELFRECSGTAPMLEGESGDVKYHKGFTGQRLTRGQKSVHLQLVVNPSHLESVDPVVLGWVKAKQVASQDAQGAHTSGLLIHGDASLAGQGVVYETLQFMKLAGYSTGGTIHIVTNNQIGFTAQPQESRSTPYCTDIARAFGAPVFHVNAEDPEGCIFAARLAVELRQKFHCDVFIDLNGYRKFGHNEGDEPSFTQPSMARWIAARPSVRALYAPSAEADGSFQAELAQTFEEAKSPAAPEPAKPAYVEEKIETAVPVEQLQEVQERTSIIPNGFTLHPKLQKSLELRKGRVDWGVAELLAFGTLLWQGIPVRLSGQDSQRGTFSHRHAVWVDQVTDERYFPLAHLKEGQGRFDIYNSPLSEFAAVAFEYGYSCAAPGALVLWEAQYGDFSNGAQVVFDQYLSSGEQKWGRTVSLVLLLPHGHEGAGPEHTSGRMERFLQMSAEGNMCVANPSTPAQYFHLIRRQGLSAIKKPLVVFTPKSLLRLPLCVSSIEELSKGSFAEILDDPIAPKTPTRLFLCSGKIYYDLLEKRSKATDLILRVEQLYPFHADLCKKIIAKYPSLSQFFWIQEEPENMGGWEYIRPRLEAIGIHATYIGRPRSASPATGSSKKHKQETEAILKAAFG